MTIQERILALRLLKKQEEKPQYLHQLGISIYMEHRAPSGSEKEETK